MFQCSKPSDPPSPKREVGPSSSSFRQELERALVENRKKQFSQLSINNQEICSQNAEVDTNGSRREVSAQQANKAGLAPAPPRVFSSRLAQTRRLVILPLPPANVKDHAILARLTETQSNTSLQEQVDNVSQQESILASSTATDPLNNSPESASNYSSNDGLDSVNAEETPPTPAVAMPTALITAAETEPEAQTTRAPSEHGEEGSYLGECNICYSQQRDHATVPCGHLYCVGCAQQQRDKGACFICNREVTMVVKIFA